MPSLPGATLADGMSQLEANATQVYPTAVTAVGASQASATPIPVGVNSVKALGSTSAKGIVLPEATAFAGTGASGLWVLPQATIGVTVYPYSGQGINALATNTGIVIASGKPAEFLVVGTGWGGSAAYRWVVQKGA